MKIGKAIDELTGFGLPSDVIQLWKARYPDARTERVAAGGYEIVIDVLNGESLLVVAPTSSGKTFIGELAAVRAATYRNLQELFSCCRIARWSTRNTKISLLCMGQVGLRVIRCSGDFTDEAGLFLSGRYDIAFLTFEMFLALGVATPHVLKRLGLVVLDEAQFVTDPTRGITVELLLTLLLAGKTRGVNQQLIALSAVIGDVNNFDEWLGSKRLVWTKRPIPLTEGVLDPARCLSVSRR